jgi:hypothetical protein
LLRDAPHKLGEKAGLGFALAVEPVRELLTAPL